MEDSERIITQNKWLIRRLQGAIQENCNLKEEVARQRNRADEEQRAWHRVHDAMNVLRTDALRVLREHGAQTVYQELEREREAHQKLNARRQIWRAVARSAVEAKAEEARKVRDLEAALDAMRELASAAEAKIEQVGNQAQEVINQRDDQICRIQEWTGRWHKGEMGALEAIAGVLAELGGFPLPSANALERHKETRYAQATSLMNEAADRLSAIECLLEDEGVGIVSSQVQQVKDYIHLQKTRGT